MVALWIHELTAYHRRVSRIIRGLSLAVLCTTGEQQARLQAALALHVLLQTQAATAIAALQFLQKHGFPALAHPWVGPETGHTITEAALDLMESLAAVDTRSDTVRTELMVAVMKSQHGDK